MLIAVVSKLCMCDCPFDKTKPIWRWLFSSLAC
jgi:hypothetical protein